MISETSYASDSAFGCLCRFFYQLAEENAKKKAAKNAMTTKWVHF